MRQVLVILGVSFLLVGCVQVPAPQPTIGMGVGIGSVQGEVSAYGYPPRNYMTAIRSYFSTKLKRGAIAQYKYSSPKRAFKRKGLAYGGDIAWKGWLVETSVAVPTRSGRYLTPRPYMVLFSGEQIVEDILGNSHKLVTKVDK